MSGGGLFCFVVFVWGVFLFVVVGQLLWAWGFFSPPSRQPAREPDGELGSLCVRLVRMRAKPACECAWDCVCLTD